MPDDMTGIVNYEAVLADLGFSIRRPGYQAANARYELKPGLATIGDQFPRQEDADNEIEHIQAALREMKGQP